MPKLLGRIAIGVGLALVMIQLVPYGRNHTNPPVRTEPVWDAAETRALAKRACFDCHSNETRYPWYSNIAPVSWLTVGHVNDGRSELNFSAWGSYGERMKETRLRAICELCEHGAMPPASYALVHRDVALSRDQVRTICEWTAKESRRLAAK